MLVVSPGSCLHKSSLRPSLHSSLSWELKLAIFGSSILGVNKLLSIACWPIFKLLNSLSKYKVVMFKVRYVGRNDTKKRSIHDKPKEHSWRVKECLKVHWLGPAKFEIELLTFLKLPPEIALGSWLRAWQNWWRACHSHPTWDPSRFASTKCLKPLQSSSSQLKCHLESGFKWTRMGKRQPTNERGPVFELTTHARVERLNSQFLGVWYMKLTSFHPKYWSNFESLTFK